LLKNLAVRQMKKLTKEQAEWLIKSLELHMGRVYKPDSNSEVVGWKKTLEIINQCTEKEFPKIDMNVIHPDFPGRQRISAQQAHFDKSICVCVDGLNCFLTSEQFKQFTTGCQRIVEWLQEQE